MLSSRRPHDATRTTIRLVFHLVVITGTLTCLGAGEIAAQQHPLDRFLTDSTLLVARLDLDKARLPEALQAIEGSNAKGLRLVQKLRKWQQKSFIPLLSDAGVREYYLVSDIMDLQQGPGFLVLPVPGPDGEAKAAKLAESLQRYIADHSLAVLNDPNFRTVQAMGSQVFIGHRQMLKRLQNAESAAREDISKRLAADSDAALDVWLVPTAEYRELVADFPIPFPSQVADTWDEVCDRFEWIGLHLSLVPRIALQAEIAAADEASAKKWRDLLVALRGMLDREFKERVQRAGRPEPSNYQAIIFRAVAQASVQQNGTMVQATAKIDSPQASTRVLAYALGSIAAALAKTPEIEARNRLRYQAIAMHNFHQDHGSFPPSASYDDNGKPLLSWRVHLLPYLGDEAVALYQRFRLDEPWNSPHNKTLIAKMPKVFQDPSGKVKEPGMTRIVVPIGEGFVFDGSETGVRVRDIRDGTSNTIMMIEAAPESAVIWTRPQDLVIDPKDPLKGVVAAGQSHFNVLAVDGALHRIPGTIDKKKFMALLTRDGREVIGGWE